MKNINDFDFSESWQLGEVNLEPGHEYLVMSDLGALKEGEIVKFIGFADVDNHYGIFVFIDSAGKVLEISGDCCGHASSCISIEACSIAA